MTVQPEDSLAKGLGYPMSPETHTCSVQIMNRVSVLNVSKKSEVGRLGLFSEIAPMDGDIELKILKGHGHDPTETADAERA